MNRRVIVLLGLLATGFAFGQRLPDFAAVRESLLAVPPKMHSAWLKERGFGVPGMTEYRKQENTGLRMVGKWGRGRAFEVTGQDSLVFLALGSEIAIVSISDPDAPRLLAELQLDYLSYQVRVRDSVLVTGRNGIDLWSITDPTRPIHLSHIPCFVSDFAVADSFLYFVSSDSFNVYNIARPAVPARVGFCRDSGYVVTATRNTVVLLMRDFLAFIDVTNPVAPRRVGTYSGWPLSATVRGNLCCATFANPSQPEQSWFAAIDISNPASPRLLARLESVCGSDIYLEGQYAFTSGRSGYEPMQILSITDSTRPAVIGSLYLPGDGGWGVWGNLLRDRVFVAADFAGFQVIDIVNPVAPVLDSVLLRADMAEDVYVDGNRAYIANYRSCLKILDISEPAYPAELGGLDSSHATSEAVVARDSFAFIGWWPSPLFRSVSVSDPTRPRMAAGGAAQTIPKDMVLRDTFVYLAGRLRFNIVNVARPRSPALVGSCVLSGDAWDLDIEDTMAYVTSNVFTMVNIARADSPRVAATWNPMVAVDVEDTIAYLVGSGAVWSLSVARPAHPYVLDTVRIAGWVSDVVVNESLAFAGGQVLYVIDKRDPRNLRVVGQWSPPHEFRRLLWAVPHLYAACYEAGVCVLETTLTGIQEAPSTWPRGAAIRIQPSVTTHWLSVEAPDLSQEGVLEVYDMPGRRLNVPAHPGGGRNSEWRLDVSTLPEGVYVVRVSEGNRSYRSKFVKIGR